ncbi:MAG: hypothetical protein ACPLRX_01545 [Candidatus Saccharicenans sp.]
MITGQMEKSIRRIPAETSILGLAVGLLVGSVYEPLSGLLVLAGALVAGGSFLGLKGTVDRWLTQPKSKFIKKALVLYLVRLGLICLIFLTIILLFKKKVIAFAAGFSLIVVSIMIEALISLVSMRQWKV